MRDAGWCAPARPASGERGAAETHESIRDAPSALAHIALVSCEAPVVSGQAAVVSWEASVVLAGAAVA